MNTLLMLIEQGKCPLAIVQPAQTNAVVQQYEEMVLARGSLLRLSEDTECSQQEKVRAEVLSSVYFYSDSVLIKQSSCIDVTALVPASGFTFYSLAPPADKTGLRVGQMLTELQDDGACNRELTFAQGQVSNQELLWLQPLTPTQAATVEQKQSEWVDLLGNWAMGRVWITEWGRLALPLKYYTSAELELEYGREKLQTDTQKEKAVMASGPNELWLHFLGADKKYSDVWGEPETIDKIIDISIRWKSQCTEVMTPPNPDSCILQVGDIAWYNSMLPDPLGHKNHYLGRCMDVRLFRTDASRYEAFWNKGDDRAGFDMAYDGQRTHAFIDLLLKEGGVPVLFGDPASNADLAARHDDHLHVCFPKQ